MKILSVLASHDASVAYFVNGKLECFLKEERFSGIKKDGGIIKCVGELVKKNYDIDTVLINSVAVHDPYIQSNLIPWIKKLFDCEIVLMKTEHHLCHAFLAFEKSKFEESLVVVIDRNGTHHEKVTEVESIFKINKNYDFETIYKNFVRTTHIAMQEGGMYLSENLFDMKTHQFLKTLNCDIKCDSSCGMTQMYESATALMGQDIHEAGKTMGLSAYGKNKQYKKLFYEGVVNSHYFFKYFDQEQENDICFNKDFIDDRTSEITKDNYQFYADYAYQVQKQTQEEVLRLVKKYTDKTGIKKVCLVGGYALNVVCNSFLVKSLPDVEFYFEPIADDTGITIGASLLYHQRTENIIPKIPYDTFFHSFKYDLKNINGELVNEKQIANYLTQGKIVAVFNGQAEVGPRALGNRSILFDARDPDAKNKINKVKNREWYRPFAAIVLEEDSKKYFNMYHLESSPEMTISFPVISNEIPGVTHVDGTSRIQTVNNSISHFYNVLNEFKKLTNVSVLLNTSFNEAGKPLIETPQQAIETFENTDIDILWFPEKSIMLTK